MLLKLALELSDLLREVLELRPIPLEQHGHVLRGNLLASFRWHYRLYYAGTRREYMHHRDHRARGHCRETHVAEISEIIPWHMRLIIPAGTDFNKSLYTSNSSTYRPLKAVQASPEQRQQTTQRQPRISIIMSDAVAIAPDLPFRQQVSRCTDAC